MLNSNQDIDQSDRRRRCQIVIHTRWRSAASCVLFTSGIFLSLLPKSVAFTTSTGTSTTSSSGRPQLLTTFLDVASRKSRPDSLTRPRKRSGGGGRGAGANSRANNNNGKTKTKTKTKKPQQSAPSSSLSSTSKPASVGQAIQQAQNVKELLDAALTLWLPSDLDLPPHYSQEIHHEKRQRWAGQLLSKIGTLISPRSAIGSTSENDIWKDRQFCRAIQAVSIPFSGREVDRPKVEGRAISEALIGLASIVGRAPPTSHASVAAENDEENIIQQSIVSSVAQLVLRAEALANDIELRDAVEMRWAARSLLARLPGLAAACTCNTQHHEDNENANVLAASISNMNARVAHLPFDIIPLGISWSTIVEGHDDENGEPLNQAELLLTLRDAIPFNFDTIITRTGSAIVERRGTAWVADDGIGALAYSGKLMPPRSLPDIVRSAMRATERLVSDDIGRDVDDGTHFFDCALCNHYPDAEAACKFHTDPEHGSLWDRLTCVVSAGDDRRFAFRPIPDQSTWNDWDAVEGTMATAEKNVPAVYHMFAGDIVKMTGRCNDDFYHAVYADDTSAMRGQGRVSLVLKRAIDRGGHRGHGLKGEGRRSRRRRQGVTESNNNDNSKGHGTGKKRSRRRR